MNNKSNIYQITIALVVSAISCILIMQTLNPAQKIAYVDTSKLMIGFSDASKIEKELKSEDEKWQKQLKELQDSLKIAMDNMTKEYDNAGVARKKELQDMLSVRNQQVNNFKTANMKRMGQLRQEKLQTVIEKVNLFIGEYGKSHGYAIILGTAAGGSILYGDEDKADITKEIIAGLNERYK